MSIISMNDVGHTIALRSLSWDSPQTEQKKANAKLMGKLLNKMGPKLRTNLCSLRVTKQIVTIGTFQAVFAYQNHTLIRWIKYVHYHYNIYPGISSLCLHREYFALSTNFPRKISKKTKGFCLLIFPHHRQNDC